jgi:hypothetical protein
MLMDAVKVNFMEGGLNEIYITWFGLWLVLLGYALFPANKYINRLIDITYRIFFKGGKQKW